MKVIDTNLKGLKKIELDLFEDERGFFVEAWGGDKLSGLGLPSFEVKQFNISKSQKGVIRGIHSEPWDKYVYVPEGSVFSAVVDLRSDSPTFGQHETFTLDKSVALFIPKGFANSYQTLSVDCIYCYLVNGLWKKEETPYPAIRYDDPEIGIAWPIKDAIVSDKDKINQSFKDYKNTL